jgi:hypothetical protein
VLIGIDEPVCFIDSPEWLNQKKSVFGENPGGVPAAPEQEPPASPSSESKEDNTHSKEDLEKGFRLPFIGKKKKKSTN